MLFFQNGLSFLLEKKILPKKKNKIDEHFKFPINCFQIWLPVEIYRWNAYFLFLFNLAGKKKYLTRNDLEVF